MNWIDQLREAAGWSRDRRPPKLELLDRLALGPQHSLHLVRVGGEEVLIGRSPGGLHVLSRTAAGRREDLP